MNRALSRSVRTALFTTLLIGCILPAALAQKAAKDSTFLTYEQDIRYALVRTCFECHSGSESRGELLLDSYENLMMGGEHGPAVEPGSPEKSILYQKISPDPPFGKQMPRKRGVTLSELEREMIRLWIAQGAHKGRSDTTGTR